MLALENITAGYDPNKLVLKGVSGRIKENAITVIMGPNGAGKSTLLNVFYGLLRPCSGSILLNGAPFAAIPRKLVKAGIFMVPQGKRVFRHMTVRENLELATHFWKDKSGFDAKVDEILSFFPDLKAKLNGAAGHLSGGQQQMVALARVLLNSPKLVLMDEPSIGLSPKLINETFYKLKEIKEKTGTGFAIVEHNLKSLLPLTDYAYIMEQGSIIYSGKAESGTLDDMLKTIFNTNPTNH